MTTATKDDGDWGSAALGFAFGLAVMLILLMGVLALDGQLKTDCDQHIIDAATERIDERLRAELVLCDYEGPLLP